MKRKNRQQGATLITALVMLVVLTLLVISAIRSSTINLRIAGNMQIHEENVAGAQVASESYISNNFTKPNLAAASGTVNIGGSSYSTEVQIPTCISTVDLPSTTPNLPQGCVSSGSYNPDGTFNLGCSSQIWDVQTTVTDPATGAKMTQHQGVSLTVGKDSPCK